MNFIKRILDKYSEKNKRKTKVLNSCGCICYCPRCNDILNDQAKCEEKGSEVLYSCSECGTKSVWNFEISIGPVLMYYKENKREESQKTECK